MLLFLYMVPLAAWIAFIYHMHHFGGRPTTTIWWAFMTALGTFELAKGIAALVAHGDSVMVALGAAVAMGGVVLVIAARRAWVSEGRDLEPAMEDAMPAGGGS